MIGASGIDWDDAFDNGGYIRDAASYPDDWAARAQAFRQAAVRAELDIAYGPSDRERCDLFQPEGAALGLVVFVHGGYWQKFDKAYWSHLAAGALALNWSVALPNYTLAPEATLPGMVAEIGRAIEVLSNRVTGPIHLAGHSAGGHLVTRMICETSPLPHEVRDRIARVVSISGLHDLRPLRLHQMNANLKLTEETAAAESAALLAPASTARVTAWVGGKERPEFLRQSAVLAESWSRQGVEADLVVEPGRHHFDVIEGLQDPAHPLTLALTGGNR